MVRSFFTYNYKMVGKNKPINLKIIFISGSYKNCLFSSKGNEKTSG